MITSQDKALIVRLIKQYAGKASTEKLIAYIADNNGMLSACKLLVEKNSEDDRETMAWVDEQCYEVKVDVRNFLYEITRILAMFQPGQESDSSYDILGLEPGADREEIKQAYRRLSLQHHPDTAHSDNSDETETFVRITKAYHALLNNENDEQVSDNPQVPPSHWRQQKKSTITKERKKKNIIWFTFLAGIMIVLSLLAANNYRQKAMIVGLQTSRSAFIPPAASRKESQKPKEPQVETREDLKKVTEEPQVKIAKTESSQSPPEANLEKKEEVKPEVPSATKEVEPTPTVTDSPPNPPSSVELSQQTSPPEEHRSKEKVSPPAPPKQETAIITPEVQKKTVPPIASSEPEYEENPPPSPEEMLRDTQQRIESFLAAYTNSYQEKNLLTFSRFFDLKATENDKPLGEIMPTYVQLFQDADQITLAISTLKWERDQETINLDGRFKIQIQYKNSKQVQGKGEIRFLLVDVQQQLFIKELHYQFDN